MKLNKEKGFSLIELLITVVVMTIVAAIAVIGYNAVVKGAKDSVRTVRLIQYADAQNKFRTVLGKRRYATLVELCEAELLNESVVKFAGDGCEKQTALDGWRIETDDESTEYLRQHFFVRLTKEALTRNEQSPVEYCIGDDGILRKQQSSRGGMTCSLSSPPAE